MGFFVTQGIVELASLEPVQIVRLTLLCVASACLYLAGMTLNDAFDADIDREERPERPIPSGRVSLSTAPRTGIWSVGGGSVRGRFAFDERGGLSAGPGGRWAGDCGRRSRCRHKRTAIGPLVMGLCRFLNVMLGMSLSPTPWQTWNYVVAGGIGLYIVGVTWFARTEARPSNRLPLFMAMLVGAAGIVLLVLFPRMARRKDSSRRFRTTRASGICCGLCSAL